MSQNTVTIEVAKRRLKVACPQGQESALLQAAEDVTQRLVKIKANSTKTPEQAMLMVALNLANDLLQTKKQHQEDVTALESKIDLLQSTIEQALQEQSPKQA